MYISVIVQVKLLDGNIKCRGNGVVGRKLCLVKFTEGKGNLHAVLLEGTQHVGVVIQCDRRFQVVFIQPVLPYDQAVENLIVVGGRKPGGSEFNNVSFVTSDFLLYIRVPAFLAEVLEIHRILLHQIRYVTGWCT